MTEDNKHIEFLELTVKYLSGETSDSEVKRLEQWVLSSPENKTAFRQMKQAWMLSAVDNNNQEIEVDEEWKNMEHSLFGKDKVVPLKPKRRLGFYLSIAAAVAALLAASIWLFIPGRGIEEFSTESVVMANTLPDGSQVVLNQYSSVRLEAKFDKKERRLKLSGDAYFEVERNVNRPFIVDAEDIEVEVLGTSFYVDSRTEQPTIEVIVASGRVAVKAIQQEIVLNAGETGVYVRATKELFKQKNEEDNYLGWKTDTLEFYKEKLETVVRSLNRKFHSQIVLDIGDTEKCDITANYTGKSLEAILKIIEQTLQITTKKEGDKIILTGEGCL